MICITHICDLFACRNLLSNALSKLKTDVGQNAPSGDRVQDRPMSSAEGPQGRSSGSREKLLGNAVLTAGVKVGGGGSRLVIKYSSPIII